MFSPKFGVWDVGFWSFGSRTLGSEVLGVCPWAWFLQGVSTSPRCIPERQEDTVSVNSEREVPTPYLTDGSLRLSGRGL